MVWACSPAIHQGSFKSSKSSVKTTGRRWILSEKAEDMYKFKVPQLYNLKDSPHYGHGASMKTIREVVRYQTTPFPKTPTYSLHP